MYPLEASIPTGGRPHDDTPKYSPCPKYASHQDDNEKEYEREVRAWILRVPIGLGLCPWAGMSEKRGLLRIASCKSDTPAEVTQVLENEIRLLIEGNSNAETPRPPLSTTLLVCPHVKTWMEFQPFDDFIRTQALEMMDQVTLVAFHPKFIRWHALPDGIGIGSTVQSHWGIFGKKSAHTATATIIESNNKAFGLRKVKVRFHDVDVLGVGVAGVSNRNQEQFVPTDWIDFSTNMDCALPSATTSAQLQLPDNIMHRSPYPTIHIIVNQDLSLLCIRDVSRVKRLNSQRMAKLGWEGLEHVLAEMR